MANETAGQAAAAPSRLGEGASGSPLPCNGRPGSRSPRQDRWLIAVDRTPPVPYRVPQAVLGASQLRYNPDPESGSDRQPHVSSRPPRVPHTGGMDPRDVVDGTRDAAAPGGRLVRETWRLGLDPRGAAGGERASTCRRRASARIGIGSMPTEVWQASAGDALELRVWAEGDRAGHGPSARDGPDRRLVLQAVVPAGAWQARGRSGHGRSSVASWRRPSTSAASSWHQPAGSRPSRSAAISRLRACPRASRRPSAGRGTARRRTPPDPARRRPTRSPLRAARGRRPG